MPQVLSRFGLDGMRDVAIDEWMGASPVYTRRTQQLLDFVGEDVETIFKGMQLDIGAPPEFMDFRYRVDDPRHGEFWLAHCGALMDVEPMGDDFVVAMCHHIEDPTFDATACATNPRARMRPLHRPPRLPADRHPHCHWTVEIDDDADPILEAPITARVAATRAARLGVATPSGTVGTDDGGRTDYAGPLDPDLRLEEFSRPTLLAILDEVCLQGHLLTIAFLMAVSERWGHDAAVEIGEQQFCGIAGVAADRIRRAFDLAPGVDGVATAFELHPAFRPRRYVDLRADRHDDGLRLVLGPCAALEEDPTVVSWLGLIRDGRHRVLDAIAQAVDPRARLEPSTSAPGEVAAWDLIIDRDPANEMREVTLTRFSTGADFVFSSG